MLCGPQVGRSDLVSGNYCAYGNRGAIYWKRDLEFFNIGKSGSYKGSRLGRPGALPCDAPREVPRPRALLPRPRCAPSGRRPGDDKPDPHRVLGNRLNDQGPRGPDTIPIPRQKILLFLKEAGVFPYGGRAGGGEPLNM